MLRSHRRRFTQLDLNRGGTQHTDEEIEKVQALLKAEKEKAG
jgi:hypothetical protein